MNFLTNIDLYKFLFLLVTTVAIGGLILASFFSKYLNRHKTISENQLVLMSMGLSPFFVTVILYYLFFFLPGKGDGFYLSVIVLVYGVIVTIAFSELKGIIKSRSNLLIRHIKANKIISTVLIIGFVLVCCGWTYYITSKSLTEHDTLEYAVQGKVFYEEKNMEYKAHRYDEKSGFYYVGLHGLSFPLLATYERVSNAFLNSDKDYFFRSLNSVYGLFILLILFLFSRKVKNLIFALSVTVGLFFTYGFFETVMKYHIDHYRVFFLLISIVLLVELVKNYSRELLILFSLFLAAQANAHSLGFLLSFIQLGVLFLFLKGGLVDRIKSMSIACVIVVLFGALHYFIDIFWGTGWLFQDIKFY